MLRSIGHRLSASSRAASLVAFAVLAGCGRGDGARHAAERAIEVVVPTSAETLDPRHARDAIAMRVTRLVHAGLVRLDERTLEPVPYVAASWRWESPRELVVELRPGVRFHGGKEVDARDVCATLAALGDPAVGSRHRDVVKHVGGCAPEGARGVRITLADAHATLLTDLELPVLRADEASSPPRPRGDLDGLGPFALADVAEGLVALEPASGGALARPSRALVVRTVRDENARALRLLAGRADVAPNAISPTLLPSLEGSGGLEVHARGGSNVTYLLVQGERPGLADAKVRRALSLAIDRDALARGLFGGHAHPTTRFYPFSWLDDPGAPARALESARPVLAGTRPLALLASTDRLRALTARVLAQQLGEAGLAVEVVPLDFGVLLERLSAGDYDLAMLQAPELTEPNVLRAFFHSSAIPSRDRAGAGGNNRARFRDGEVDAWLDAAAAELDLDRRRALYERIAARLEREMPVVPLWREDQVAVVSPRARAFVPSAEGRWLGLASLP